MLFQQHPNPFPFPQKRSSRIMIHQELSPHPHPQPQPLSRPKHPPKQLPFPKITRRIRIQMKLHPQDPLFILDQEPHPHPHLFSQPHPLSHPHVFSHRQSLSHPQFAAAKSLIVKSSRICFTLHPMQKRAEGLQILSRTFCRRLLCSQQRLFFN